MRYSVFQWIFRWKELLEWGMISYLVEDEHGDE
jgi:hypothetical protein